MPSFLPSFLPFWGGWGNAGGGEWNWESLRLDKGGLELVFSGGWRGGVFGVGVGFLCLWGIREGEEGCWVWGLGFGV